MRRNWSFRKRLTALIAAVFILCAVGLLTVQYFLVKWLLLNAVVAEAPNLTDSDAGGLTAVTVATNATVLQNLQIWSALILIIFAFIATILANFLAKRSLGRISQICDTTKQITGTNRKERLDLQGPNDEIKELGYTIDGMLNRLDEALTRQENFIAAASHELRTPLTTTRIALEIPQAQGKFGADTAAQVERALEANRRSEEILAGLLTLASIQSNAAEALTIEQVRAAYISAVAEMLPLAEDHHVELEVMSLPGQTTNPGLLQVALENLVKNAIIHGANPGSVEFCVSFLTAPSGLRSAEFVVRNAGEVIDVDAVSNFVEPFNRGGQTRLSSSGLGLGLTVVQAIARHLDAKFELIPRRGGGLEARLQVPVYS